MPFKWREKWKMFFCMVSVRVEASRKKVIKKHYYSSSRGENSKEGRAATTKNEHLTPFIKLGTFYSAFF
jgi:hypothetical protein